MANYKDYLLFVCGIYFCYRLFKNYYWNNPKKNYTNDTTKGIIYLVDQNIDHLFSVKDIISPQADAFDKPHAICRDISLVPENIHIRIVISTKGESLTSCEKILRKLLKRENGYTVYIKNECFSTGTMIALGAKEIVMMDDSYLGKIDPQISYITNSYPAIAYYDLHPKYISSDNIDKVKISAQVINYTLTLLDLIFNKKRQRQIKENIKKEMIFSKFPHSKTFDQIQCKQIGLNIRTPTEEEKELFGEL